MTFEQQWIEYDYNPFVLFSSNGKVISLNAEAQFLLGAITVDELFSFATTYANLSFGFKTTFIELEFGRYKFFALTVGYENDDEIGIKLYQAPSFKLNKPKPVGEMVNIYTLVDLCISTNSINSQIKFLKEFDPTIPEIVIDSNSFIKILNSIYSCFNENKEIYRHISKEDSYKKNYLYAIDLVLEYHRYAQKIDKEKANKLEIFIANTSFYIDIKKKITINVPMITS